VLPIICQPFTTAGPQEYENVLLAALRSIAADPGHCSSRWLGYFSLDQVDRLERLFEQVIRQIFWNIGSVFGTFFKIIYLLNYKASCKMLLQGYYMFYGQYFCWLHTYQTSRYVRNYVL